MNLHQKLVEIRKSIDGFTKDTQGYGYKYVSGTQVLAKIHGKMNELGVILQPELSNLQHEVHPYVDKNGKDKIDFIVFGQMSYTWFDSENPEDKIIVPWYVIGQQDETSKALGSGLTYSERYFLLKYFNVPTDADDPDAKDTKGTQARPQQPSNIITEAQLKRMYAIASGDEKKVKEVLKKNGYSTFAVKKADYEKICKELEG